MPALSPTQLPVQAATKCDKVHFGCNAMCLKGAVNSTKWGVSVVSCKHYGFQKPGMMPLTCTSRLAPSCGSCPEARMFLYPCSCEGAHARYFPAS